MGLINFGVPKKETDYLKRILELDVFVEGGTYKGGTAKEMSEFFRKVITIEKSDVMHGIAKQNLKDISNITMLNGDTREHLIKILENNDNIFFWLDAHWSGGDTYGKEDECPLIEELEVIFDYPKNYVILIDDARLFLAPPPYPHNFNNWQSITDIARVIPDSWELLVYEDVIYLYPKKIDTKFKTFIQELISNKKNEPNNFIRKALRKVGMF